ncbi:hypothetical protein PQD69_gp083 [Carnobacterium phage cd4]|uniref:Uncharacterized protein n=1 Tax=Carnobacterium phage cd4 TaxID=2849246 RepID=A0AAE7SS59_9CAUD|nr:hypothetical protein PQD69_gp083 [Carnobacterium phage cd4]QXP45427.1 hypothetical protein cd4_083 [Carnobacterium phage cd4]
MKLLFSNFLVLQFSSFSFLSSFTSFIIEVFGKFF